MIPVFGCLISFFVSNLYAELMCLRALEVLVSGIRVEVKEYYLLRLDSCSELLKDLILCRASLSCCSGLLPIVCLRLRGEDLVGDLGIFLSSLSMCC